MNMRFVDQILYYTGGIVWTIIAIIVSFMIVLFMYENVLKPFWHGLWNLTFFLFGKKLPEGMTYLELWQKKYAHRSGVREHWKSWACFRRLAYIKILREARKELNARKEESK